MDITPFLRLMVDKDASDIFFYVGAPVHIKIDGVVRPVGNNVLGPGDVKKLAYSLLREEQIHEFEQEMELNFAIPLKGVGRFRANVFRQRGQESMVIRYIKANIPSIEELHLPPILKELIMEKRGLMLMVGATGSGKSTSLAAMIDYRNTNLPGHILTIEDPVEFIHSHKRSVIGQREIGLDTHSYGNALKSALREAPDVILIGEVRDADTMKYALQYAETGHLCLSTLHANNANGALDRIVNFFSEGARDQLLMDMSMNLRAVVSQRLIRSVDGVLMPAVEVLLNTPYISELIQQGNLDAIKEAMVQSTEAGMRTFDQSLIQLFSEGRITKEEAIRNADSRNDIALKLRMDGDGASKTKKSALALPDDPRTLLIS